MSRVKHEIERPTVIVEPGQNTKLDSERLKLKPLELTVKTETQRPTVIVYAGPIVSLKPEPSSRTDNEEPENETELSDDRADPYSPISEDDDDSDNPNDYHPTIFIDPFDDGDPHQELTDVRHLVVNLGTAKKMNFEKDANGDYKCPETSCKYSTKKKYLLAHHYKRHGEKQYECRICAKKFAQREYCMSHIRTHDDRYKFRCDVCRRLGLQTRFAVYQQLRKHSRDKHGIELEPRRRKWIWIPAGSWAPGHEFDLPPLPRMNSRGKLW